MRSVASTRPRDADGEGGSKFPRRPNLQPWRRAMIQADTRTMPSRAPRPLRWGILALGASIPALALAMKGTDEPPRPRPAASIAAQQPPAPPSVFAPLEGADMVKGQHGAARAFASAVAPCDRAASVVSPDNAQAAAAHAAEVCSDAAARVGMIPARGRTMIAMDQCANAYADEVEALRNLARGAPGGAGATVMHQQLSQCLSDLGVRADANGPI